MNDLHPIKVVNHRNIVIIKVVMLHPMVVVSRSMQDRSIDSEKERDKTTSNKTKSTNGLI